MLISLALAEDSKAASVFSGNPPITPRWAFEPWVWEDNTNTQASTQSLVDGYLSRDIPVGAVIIDSPWETEYNTLEWDTNRYPQPQAMIDDLHAKGIRVVMWITGFENVESPNYNFVKQQGYVVDNGEDFEWWKGTGVHIDFTNPDAKDWWHGRMDNVLDMGIDGWKVDQSPDRLGGTIDTSIGTISKQEFKEYYYADFYDYTTNKNPQGIALARPYSSQGGFGAPISKLNMGWPGDNQGNWGGLVEQLDDIYRSAEAGYGAFGAEVGGYYGEAPGKEVLIRWAQLGATTPLMENGGVNGGNTNHLPWFHDSETVDIYRYFATLHSELVPYIFSYGVESHLSGESIIRSPDRTRWQHQLGEEIFVSALTSSASQKSVTFPEGADWIDYWDHSTVYQGGSTLDYSAPLDRYPIFIKAGAIIPMHVRNSLTGHGDEASAGKETILIFPGGQSSFLYHKPLGDGIEYADVSISMDEAQGVVAVNGAIAEDYILRIKWPVQPDAVEGADQWSYDAQNQTLIVERTGDVFQVAIDSTLPADFEPPQLVSVDALGPNHIEAVFDEMVAASSASDPASFTIASAADPGYQAGKNPLSVELSATARGVKLTLADSLKDEASYILEVNDVADLSGNAIAPGSQASFTFVQDFTVSNVSAASGRAYQVSENGLTAGAPLYIDRGFAFSAIPEELEGATYILTANDDKSAAGAAFLTFEVNRDATVYVAYDNRATSLPDWLSGWTDTGLTLGTTDVERVVLSRDFPAGALTLGGNLAAGASGANSNYSVIAASKEAPGSQPPVNLSPLVNAGPDQAITLPETANLDGNISDDGFPGGALSVSWSKVSGPGSVIFSDAGAASTTASFSAAGSYVLRLTANDGELAASDEVAITVNPEPAPAQPVVKLGNGAAIYTGKLFSMEGSVTAAGDASLTASVDYGDGSGVMPLALNGDTFSLSHEYPDEGAYTVTVTVTDSDGAEGMASVWVEVRLRFPTLPGMNSPARDLSGDGRAEDLNGNGRLDFADVVLLFRHLQSPEVQSDAELFDFNGNGRVDTADVIVLFKTLV